MLPDDGSAVPGWKLLTESQQVRMMDALGELDRITDELTEEHADFPDALEQVMFFTAFALKEVEEMPVVSDGFYTG